MTRQQKALGDPPASSSGLTGFPRWTLAATRTLYRAHSASSGPWWYASAHGTDTDGRFDLPDPYGTCYFAGTVAGAVRERWGRNLVRQGYIMDADADNTLVSTLRVPSPHRLADLVNGKAANYGMTREIGTTVPYARPQAWAVAFHALGCAGIRYEPRFSTGPRDLAYALFGTAGPAPWATDPAPTPGRSAAVKTGIRVVSPPARVRIASPPTT